GFRLDSDNLYLRVGAVAAADNRLTRVADVSSEDADLRDAGVVANARKVTCGVDIELNRVFAIPAVGGIVNAGDDHAVGDIGEQVKICVIGGRSKLKRYVVVIRHLWAAIDGDTRDVRPVCIVTIEGDGNREWRVIREARGAVRRKLRRIGF